MNKVGLLVTVKAQAGKEQAVADFLASAVELARQEELTLTWYAFQIDASTFGVFDSFAGDEGRDAHLTGEIAKALMAHAAELLSEAPKIEKIDILSSK
ncbi:MAG: antibiotic biosynthesis monooxygenase [Microscillaceae bacterium]|nr:antibiotic biosynthesis monooxygenase [Microscillaceae bacterium]